MTGGGFTTSQTRGSSSKTRWPQLPNRLQCRRRDGCPPWHSRRCRSGLRQPSSSSGRCSTGSEGRRWCHRRPTFASHVSRIFPASRSLRPFHQTAGRWRSPLAWVANHRFSCSALLAARLCKSRAMQSITSALVGRPTRARSCISRRRYQEPSRGASGRSRRLAACPKHSFLVPTMSPAGRPQPGDWP